MDAAPIITRELLAPLLEGGWAGRERAWKVLVTESCSPLIKRAVAFEYRKSGLWHRVLEDQGDLLAYTLCDLIEKVERKQGLALPSSYDKDDLSGWLAVVVRNQVRDVLRRLRIQEQETLTREGDTERARPVKVGTVDRSVPSSMDEDLDIQRAHGAIRSLLERGDVPPVQALAWVLLSSPHLLIREWVDRASGLVQQGHVGTHRGLVREPDESWTLICVWSDRHDHHPSSRASRRELAWILRSDDSHSVEHWRATAPDELRKAMDILRKWENRFRPLVRELLGEEAP